jgi:hypothetical protein
MSYDLVVWEGERPADGATAERVLDGLYRLYIDGAEDHPPTERISAYVATLIERWGDTTSEDEDAVPWSAGPLIGEGRGPLLYFCLRWSMADEISAQAAAIAHSMGLVCFDPQLGRLRP